jgi:hypothetical protein
MTAMTESIVFNGRGRCAALIALMVVLAGLSSCQTDEDAKPGPRIFRGADETVRGAGTMEVKNAVVDVMTENGFRMASPFGSMMTFEKEGTRNDELMYGSYGSRPMRQRVTITVTPGEKPDTVELFASGNVVREYGHMTGEESGWLPAGGALRYGKYLDMIRDRVHRQVRERQTF